MIDILAVGVAMRRGSDAPAAVRAGSALWPTDPPTEAPAVLRTQLAHLKAQGFEDGREEGRP